MDIDRVNCFSNGLFQQACTASKYHQAQQTIGLNWLQVPLSGEQFL
jgi:hypothetical protein